MVKKWLSTVAKRVARTVGTLKISLTLALNRFRRAVARRVNDLAAWMMVEHKWPKLLMSIAKKIDPDLQPRPKSSKKNRYSRL